MGLRTCEGARVWPLVVVRMAIEPLLNITEKSFPHFASEPQTNLKSGIPFRIMFINAILIITNKNVARRGSKHVLKLFLGKKTLAQIFLPL